MTGFNAAMSHYGGGFKGGLTVRGMPLAVSHPGKVFFVSDTGLAAFPNRKTPSNGNDGSFMAPFATIDFAIGQCTASRGDIIFVLPGHVETISTATSLALDVAGVAVVGLGSGSLQPQLNYSATAGTIDVTADNVTLINLNFKADVTGVTLGVDVSADYFTMIGCHFDYNATGDDFVTMLDIDTSHNALIQGNTFRAEDTAGCNEAIRIDASDHCEIRGNTCLGDFTDGCIIGEGAAGSHMVIADNYLENLDTTGGEVIDLNVAFTGLCIRNHCGTLFATAPETAFDPGSLLCVENYVVNAIDESAALVPTTVST